MQQPTDNKMWWKYSLNILLMFTTLIMGRPSDSSDSSNEPYFEECGRLFHDRNTAFVANGITVDRRDTVRKKSMFLLSCTYTPKLKDTPICNFMK